MNAAMIDPLAALVLALIVIAISVDLAALLGWLSSNEPMGVSMTNDDDLDELLRQGKIEEYLARAADMTDEQLMRHGEAAMEEYEARCAEMRAAILPMAYGLMAALYEHRTAAEFEAWRKTSGYADFSGADIAALLKIAEHCQIAEEFLRTTTLVEPQEIWNAIKDRAEPVANR